MLEKELQAAVIDCARIFGWRIAHFRSVPVRRGSSTVWQTPVQADGAGFPDLVLVRERVLFVELKVGRNVLSTEQTAWINALRTAGEEARIWTDNDWEVGIIEAQLQQRLHADAA